MTFTDYANEHGVTLAEAIADRDHPMTKHDCIHIFSSEAGRNPTEDELDVMRPDAQHIKTEVNQDLRTEMSDWS